MNKFFITTAIDYPNALPHIGTAFEKIGADVQARYQRFIGKEVCFLMGNDENTWKVFAHARELGIDPNIYCRNIAEEFKKTWNILDISFDNFIQTTEDKHYRGVIRFIEAVNKAGYIYKKKYSGLYCEGCESFKTNKELVNNRCPDHTNLELKQIEEENYFFRLSVFRDRLLDLYKSGEFSILPVSKLNEIIKFVENDLQDISISRNNNGWGIPVPWDNTQVIYVWFDALINYLTGIGFGSNEKDYKNWWPADIHCIGKDITRFHCALWIAMIWAYNAAGEDQIALPSKVYVHGFIHQNNGLKISKSGKRIDPLELINLYGVDAYRYFFLSKCDYGSDNEFDIVRFNKTYNSDLANNLGNLISRFVSMSLKYLNGKLDHIEKWDFSFDVITEYCEKTERFEYRDVFMIIFKLLNDANYLIEESKPWQLFKSDFEKCSKVLYRVANLLQVISFLLKSYLPNVSEKIYNIFVSDVPFKEISFIDLVSLVKYEVKPIVINNNSLVDGVYKPLFPRIYEN